MGTESERVTLKVVHHPQGHGSGAVLLAGHASWDMATHVALMAVPANTGRAWSRWDLSSVFCHCCQLSCHQLGFLCPACGPASDRLGERPLSHGRGHHLHVLHLPGFLLWSLLSFLVSSFLANLELETMV